MKNPFSRQSQFELFPDSPGQPMKKERSYVFGRSFEFSLENMVIGGVVFLMVLVVAFSFGIERGKRIVKADGARESLNRLKPEPKADPQVKTAVADEDKEVLAASLLENPSKESYALQEVAHDILEEETISIPEKSVDKTASLETIHTIQVASFKQLNRAELEASDLKKLNYDAFTAKKGTYYIVCVGRFAERQQANELLKPLRKRYSDCYVRRL